MAEISQPRNDGFARQTEKLQSVRRMLEEGMPECFFLSLKEHTGDLLPLLADLSPASGVRRADFGKVTLLAYYRSEENNLRANSRKMVGCPLASVSVYTSSKPVEFGGKPFSLVVEMYEFATAEAADAAVSFAELAAAFEKQFGVARKAELEELYGRLNFAAVSAMNAEQLAKLADFALHVQGSDTVRVERCEAVSPRFLGFTLALTQPIRQKDLFAQLTEAADVAGFDLMGACFCELTKGGAETDFHHQSVTVASLTLQFRQGGEAPAEALKLLEDNLRLVNYVDLDDLLHRELVRRRGFRADDVNFLRAAAEFVHSQFSFIDRNAYGHNDIFRFLALAPALSAELVAEFRARFAPGSVPAEGFSARFAAAVGRINSGEAERDGRMRNVFRALGNFLEGIRKTNFFVADKAALAFRLTPDFLGFYQDLDPRYSKSFPSDCPFGAFFFHRRGVVGYQVRFSEIARGGWRTVVPVASADELERLDLYNAAKDEFFREVYVLAHTQHLKNKDIYEGGSKMITLLEPIADRSLFKATLWQAQRAVFGAFLSLINYDDHDLPRDRAIVDRLGGREIIEIGPDENMFDTMIVWMGETAVKKGYTLGSGIISGKPDTGINHKEYGVTSFGVHQYVLKTLAELGIDARSDEFSVKISGGPAGDVAGNEMKLLLAEDADGKPLYPGMRLTAITDGPAVVYDPNGIDRGEIKRMLFRLALDAFEPERLGEGGYILFSAPQSENGSEYYRQLTRQGGKLVEERLARDEFMRRFQRNLTFFADLFIPAGGRPSTINESNFESYFPEGKASFRAIVEGANSFISPGARELIQQRGVWIVKDASANKCGVITSSHEILAGLMLSEDEFREVKEELVEEVMGVLYNCAVREANWLYNRFHAEKIFLTHLTDRLSREINEANDRIFQYLGDHPELITDNLIKSHLPGLFSTRFADRPARLPAAYRRAIVSMELACRLVYNRQGEDFHRQLTGLMSVNERP